MKKILLFDLPCFGFARWARKRLELLGYRIVFTRYRYDHHIAHEADTLGAVVVTYDKKFPYTRKIVLDQNRQYEEQITQLIKSLAGLARGDVQAGGLPGSTTRRQTALNIR